MRCIEKSRIGSLQRRKTMEKWEVIEVFHEFVAICNVLFDWLINWHWCNWKENLEIIIWRLVSVVDWFWTLFRVWTCTRGGGSTLRWLAVIKLTTNYRNVVYINIRLWQEWSYPVDNQIPRHEDVLRRGIIAPLMLNLGSRWRCVVRFTPQPPYPRVKRPRHPQGRKTDGS
jgi:hypothetical protein